MIKHIGQTIALFCLIAFFALTGIAEYLTKAWIIAVPLIVLCLGYAAYKTHLAKHVPKVLLCIGLLNALWLCATPVLAASLEELKNEQDEIVVELNELYNKTDLTAADKIKIAADENRYKTLAKEIKAAEGQSAKVCETPQQLLKNVQDNCWSCDLTYIIIQTVDRVTTSFTSKMTGANGVAIIVLALAFAFWLLFRIIKLFSTLGMSDIGAAFSEIFKKTIAVMCVAIILVSMPIKTFFDWTVTPLFNFTAGVTMSVADVSAYGSEKPMFTEALGVSPNQCSYCNPSSPDVIVTPTGANNVQSLKSVTEWSFSPQLKNSMLCIVCSLYKIVSPPTIIGQSLMCYANTEGAFTVPPKGVPWPFERWQFPNLLMWVIGCLVWLTFFIIVLLFPFYLIDAFVRLGFVTVLTPFLLIAAVFQSTRGYISNAIKMLLYSLFTFVTMSMLLLLLVRIFYVAFEEHGAAIGTALANNDIEALFDQFNFTSGFMMTIMCIFLWFLSFKLIHDVDSFTQSYTGIALESTGGIIAAGTAANFVVAPIDTVMNIYGDTWTKGGKSTSNAQKGKQGNQAKGGAERRAEVYAKQANRRFDDREKKMERTNKTRRLKAERKGQQQRAQIQAGFNIWRNNIRNSKSASNSWVQNLSANIKLGGLYALEAAAKAQNKSIEMMKRLFWWTSGKTNRFAYRSLTGRFVTNNKYFTKTLASTGSRKKAIAMGIAMPILEVARWLVLFIPGKALADTPDAIEHKYASNLSWGFSRLKRKRRGPKFKKEGPSFTVDLTQESEGPTITLSPTPSEPQPEKKQPKTSESKYDKRKRKHDQRTRHGRDGSTSKEHPPTRTPTPTPTPTPQSTNETINFDTNNSAESTNFTYFTPPIDNQTTNYGSSDNQENSADNHKK